MAGVSGSFVAVGTFVVVATLLLAHDSAAQSGRFNAGAIARLSERQ
jgi:hypothetical protein